MSMAIEAPRRSLTADEFLRMAEVGIFGPDDHVELLDGEIVEMSPQGHAHGKACTKANETLVLAYSGSPYEVRPMITFRAGPRSVPEPDFGVVSRAEYGIVDVALSILIVEVSDSSLKVDREWKASIYARAGAPLYWIVEIPYRRVRVLSDPREGDYHRERVVDEDGELLFPGIERSVTVGSLLHPPAA